MTTFLVVFTDGFAAKSALDIKKITKNAAAAALIFDSPFTTCQPTILDHNTNFSACQMVQKLFNSHPRNRGAKQNVFINFFRKNIANFFGGLFFHCLSFI